MSTAPAARLMPVRYLQLARAVMAAIAAALITFSTVHSAQLGVSVFSGFAIVTGLLTLMAAWSVYPKGRRGTALGLGVLSIIAGMIGGFPPIRTVTMFFALLIPWAILTGVVELVDGVRSRRAAAAGSPQRSEARDAVTVGILTVVLGLALLLVPGQYALQYYIAEAHRHFTLTGTTIAVGIFGGYAAIVAVYLGIAAFSPRAAAPQQDAAASETPTTEPHPGGAR
ncbi:MAG TPA: DUF308 domain-containing protein [Microbacterium sp.]|uniref:DUF308 domain-containing protein n=1 Tax=Microbacterium sp. TaxID=51671 RepID=UPI002B4810A3|nr:DUF308 domain-containing protein [Microbacterium sp.]HKT58000.1 DUF308 domain-containing protein [Microbacterium sp.]